MAIIVQCPQCGTGVKLPNDSSTATCPECIRSFESPRRRDEDDTRSLSNFDDADTESQLPGWISPWGVTALCLGALALFSTILSSRNLSSSLAVLGLAAVGAGLAATAGVRWPRDRAWFCISGGANIGILGLIFFAGGLLNPRWGIDAAVSKPDPNVLVVVPINQEIRTGQTLQAEDVIDAAHQAVLQADVFVRILEVQAGPVPEQGAQPYLLVNFRLAGRGNEKPILFEGFRKDKHQPKLTDGTGRSHAFLQQRKRKLPAGGIVFLPAAPETAEIFASRFLDYQLVFELPPGEFAPLQLDLPASAWGRQGVLRFRINGLFEAIVPAPKEN